MIKDITNIKIGTIWNDARGSSFKDTIESESHLSADINLKSPITANLMMVKVKDGVIALINDLEVDIGFTCNKCNESFIKKIKIESFERQFHSHPLAKDEDSLEIFQISMKDLSIDLTEALRQEIILHFPMIPVCSEHCKGLCFKCKVNLNKTEHLKTCTYQDDSGKNTSTSSYKPFANLKELINKNNK